MEVPMSWHMISTKKTIKTKNLFSLKHLELLPLPERLLMILMNSPILGQVSRKKLKINLRKCKTKLRLFDAATAITQVETGNSLNST